MEIFKIHVGYYDFCATPSPICPARGRALENINSYDNITSRKNKLKVEENALRGCMHAGNSQRVKK